MSDVLTTKYRPHVFEDVIGQNLAKKTLSSVAKNYQRSPRSLVLYGPWGTGKTTLARIFGRALSCKSFNKTGKICMKCEGCKTFDTVSNKYIEYDSGQVGNVQQVKDLKPVFELWTDYPRVIVFDEAHLISRSAQSALLKVIEEGVENTFFLFVSTDEDKILKTIKSRSLPVEFSKVDQPIIEDRLKSIWEKEVPDEEVPSDVLEKIAFKVDGHVRDSIMLLSGYIITRDESALDVPVKSIAGFFLLLGRGEQQRAEKLLSEKIMNYPLVQIRRALNYVIMRMLEEYTTKRGSNYQQITSLYKQRILDIFKLVSELWVQGVFSDKYLTYSFFLTVMRLFTFNKQ